MNRVIGIISAMPLALAVTDAQQKTAATLNETIQEILVAYERALYDAVAKADRVAFESLVLPEGVWTTPLGFTPMNLLADGLGSFESPKWSIENPRVIWSDENAALLLYVRTGGGTLGEQRFPAKMLASTLWTTRNGKWLAVHHQETEVTKN